MTLPAPRRLTPEDAPATLALIRAEFAFMDGRIDPPSSMHRLSGATILDQNEAGEVWVIGNPPCACIFLTPQADSLYLGKLAVAASARGTGLARRLIALAETRAQSLGLPALELSVRVELTENHAAFRALGFVETGRTAHKGYARPTSVTFRRPV